MVPVWDNGLHSVQDVGIRGRWLSTIADWVVEKCSAPPGITLCVEGNIGAGKSTYLDMVMEGSKSDCSRVHEMVEVVPEPVEMWQNVNGGNLLELFYENPKRYAFTFQQYVFVTRMQTVRPRRSNPGSHRFWPRDMAGASLRRCCLVWIPPWTARAKGSWFFFLRCSTNCTQSRLGHTPARCMAPQRTCFAQ